MAKWWSLRRKGFYTHTFRHYLDNQQLILQHVQMSLHEKYALFIFPREPWSHPVCCVRFRGCKISYKLKITLHKKTLLFFFERCLALSATGKKQDFHHISWNKTFMTRLSWNKTFIKQDFHESLDKRQSFYFLAIGTRSYSGDIDFSKIITNLVQSYAFICTSTRQQHQILVIKQFSEPYSIWIRTEDACLVGEVCN